MSEFYSTQFSAAHLALLMVNISTFICMAKHLVFITSMRSVAVDRGVDAKRCRD